MQATKIHMVKLPKVLMNKCAKVHRLKLTMVIILLIWCSVSTINNNTVRIKSGSFFAQ